MKIKTYEVKGRVVRLKIEIEMEISLDLWITKLEIHICKAHQFYRSERGNKHSFFFKRKHTAFIPMKDLMGKVWVKQINFVALMGTSVAFLDVLNRIPGCLSKKSRSMCKRKVYWLPVLERSHDYRVHYYN